MLWIAIILLSLICIIPCWYILYSTPTTTDTQQSALRIYQSQLNELNHDLEHGFILKEEYDQAKLEIQRRLLLADKEGKTATSPLKSQSKAASLLIALGVICIPCAAMGLYLINGSPSLPAQPLAPRIAEQAAMDQQVEPYLQELRQKLITLSPTDPKRREGYLLLGNVEASRRHFKEAAAAWKEALTQQYDPTLAVQCAEAQIQADQTISKESADLLKQALAQAPSDAPWKELVEQRLVQYAKAQTHE